MNKLYLLLLFYVSLFKASGQAGSLDPTFGNNGIQTTAFISNGNTLYEEGRAVLTNANGYIFIIILVHYNGNGYDTRVVKYLPDGRLDSSYGNAGYSSAVHLLNVSTAALQEDKIIVGGSAYNSVNNTSDFTFARYTADGKLDSSFGVNGKVTTDFNNSN